MRIALVGAPGSGKTALAKRLEAGGLFEVTDEYTNNFSDITDQALGHFAGWTTNLQVAFERLRWEQIVNSSVPQITCGTVIDTLAYVGIHMKTIETIADLEERMFEFHNAQYAILALGLLFRETWNYDLVFYLPHADPKGWDEALDRELPAWLEEFFIAYTRLEGSIDDQLHTVTQAIAAHQEGSAEASEPAER